MKELKREKKPSSAKELAYTAVFVAFVIGAQLALSVIPGVEIVTVSFVAYGYVFGYRRGMVAATAFSLLRQFVFGFFPIVLILYLIYYNALVCLFGWFGKKKETRVPVIVVAACLCTIGFSMLDNILTPIFYGYSLKMTKYYFFASLPFSIFQTLCTAITVWLLFLPLKRIFFSL